MKFDIMRHAQSESNIGIDKFNPSLSDEGRMQASQIEGEYDLVIISPLIRTFQTLLYSKIKYKYITVSSLCREYLDGCKWNHLEHEQCSKESNDDVQQRARLFIEYVLEQSKTFKSILVISHGVWISFFVKQLVANCQRFTLEVNE